jgi:hypothetical protein
MAGKTYYYCDLVLNVLRNSGITAPTTIYLALLSAAPPNDGDPGTEISGGGYARQSITFSAPQAGTGQARRILSNADVIFGPATANWPQVVAAAIRDALTGGNMLYWGSLTTPKTIETGDQLRFPAGNVIISED